MMVRVLSKVNLLNTVSVKYCHIFVVTLTKYCLIKEFIMYIHNYFLILPQIKQYDYSEKNKIKKTC